MFEYFECSDQIILLRKVALISASVPRLFTLVHCFCRKSAITQETAQQSVSTAVFENGLEPLLAMIKIKAWLLSARCTAPVSGMKSADL